MIAPGWGEYVLDCEHWCTKHQCWFDLIVEHKCTNNQRQFYHRTHAFIGCVCIQAYASMPLVFVSSYVGKLDHQDHMAFASIIMMSPMPLTSTDLNDDISWNIYATIFAFQHFLHFNNFCIATILFAFWAKDPGYYWKHPGVPGPMLWNRWFGSRQQWMQFPRGQGNCKMYRAHLQM